MRAQTLGNKELSAEKNNCCCRPLYGRKRGFCSRFSNPLASCKLRRNSSVDINTENRLIGGMCRCNRRFSSGISRGAAPCLELPGEAKTTRRQIVELIGRSGTYRATALAGGSAGPSDRSVLGVTDNRRPEGAHFATESALIRRNLLTSIVARASQPCKGRRYVLLPRELRRNIINGSCVLIW